MPSWTDSALGYVQLAINAGALIAGAAVWRFYFEALKASVASKSDEISNVKSSRDYWKEKAEELEKRSPEFMEKMLEDRIKTREAEIARLAGDRQLHEESLRLLAEEKALIEETLKKTKVFQAVLDLEAEDGIADEGHPLADEDYEVVKLGEVGVDTGQLLLTDPSYIDTEWEVEAFHGAPDHYEDIATGSEYRLGSDFSRLDEVVPALGTTVNDLIAQGKMVGRFETPDSFNYSYKGACDATLAKGYGELRYRMGHTGAGVAFSTGWGDGVYPVYGERRGGRMVRIYVNVDMAPSVIEAVMAAHG